jgi:RNA polymerase sigma-70 factor (ECF subfamily)
MEETALIPHLFRSASRKLVAVLCRRFSFEQLDWAEDIVAETFLAALETWPYRGVPANPVAWLHTVAANKAKNQLGRRQHFRDKIAGELAKAPMLDEAEELDLSAGNVNDSQLQMLFAVCHPAIMPEGQVALALRVLCGFGIEEIANAFLTSKETVSKRIARAKDRLRSEKIEIAFPPADELGQRLSAVLTTIYLLFNEGYYSESDERILREELCFEAMRLTSMLLDNEATNKPEVNALMALMCFHASRFPARVDGGGEMVLYHDQDEKLWDQSLIARGAYHANLASTGNTLSTYHLEAAIAYWHTQKKDSKEKWEQVLQLYNQLLQLAYSPVTALNRTYALSKVHGKKAAIEAAEKLQLKQNPYYHSLLGELYSGVDDQVAITHYQTAIEVAKRSTEKELLFKRKQLLVSAF